MKDFNEFAGIVMSEGFRSHIDEEVSKLRDRLGDVDDAAFVAVRNDLVNLVTLRRYHEWLHSRD